MIRFHRQFDPHKIRLLIFDLDGTIIDSRMDLIQSINAMLRNFQRPELPGDLIATYVGDGAPMLVRRALGNDVSEPLLQKALDYFLGYYRIHKLDHTVIYDGIPEALAVIATPHNGFQRQMAICRTSQSTPHVTSLMRSASETTSFAFMAGTVLRRRNPIPKARSKYCKRQRLSPKRH